MIRKQRWRFYVVIALVVMIANCQWHYHEKIDIDVIVSINVRGMIDWIVNPIMIIVFVINFTLTESFSIS